MELKVNAQGETPILTINPGATDSDSQNPIAPRNIIIPVGTMVIWLKRLYHQIVSGTPDKGPSNIFYGGFFGTGNSHNVTFNNPSIFNYYDPTWTNINGQTTVIVPDNKTNHSNIIQYQTNNNNSSAQQTTSSSSNKINNNTLSIQANILIGNNLLLSGLLSSFLSTPSGN
jgi:hypothetical protein